MHRVSIREARQRLSQLVDAAERGESIAITRHGRQAACLGPPRPEGKPPVPDLTEFRQSIAVSGKPLSKVVIDARRQERF